MRVDTFVSFAQNTGVARGLNTAFFRLCRAPRLLSLEEDWLARPAPPDALPVYAHALRAASAVLAREPAVAGVVLRNETYDAWLVPGAWQRVARAGALPAFDYRLYCAQPESGNVFGAYTNGAALYDRARLLALRDMRKIDRRARSQHARCLKVRVIRSRPDGGAGREPGPQQP